MPAPYTSWQLSNPRRHPTCWASSHWSHTVSSAPCRGDWTSAPLSAHPSSSASNWESHLYLPNNTSSVHLITTTCMWRSVRITNGMRSGQTVTQASALSSPTPSPTPLEWPSQEEPASGLRPSVGRFRSCLYKRGMASFCGLWVWRRRTNHRPCCPPMSNPLTSPRTAWPDTSGRPDGSMRQPNDSSTPAPRSSAAKQWFEQLAQKKEKNSNHLWNADFSKPLCQWLLTWVQQRSSQLKIFSKRFWLYFVNKYLSKYFLNKYLSKPSVSWNKLD